MCFCYFVIISPWKRAGPFIWITLNALQQSMHCAKFCKIDAVVLEKKMKMWKQRRQRILIRKAHSNLRLGELKSEQTKNKKGYFSIDFSGNFDSYVLFLKYFLFYFIHWTFLFPHWRPSTPDEPTHFPLPSVFQQ